MTVFNIKQVRKNKNISLKELSDMTNISVSYLSDLENNKKTNPTLYTLYVVAKALEVNIKDLFYTKLDIDKLKEIMYKRIDKFGLNSPEVMEISQIIDLLVTLDLKQE